MPAPADIVLLGGPRAEDRIRRCVDALCAAGPTRAFLVVGATTEGAAEVVRQATARVGASLGWVRASPRTLSADLARPRLAAEGRAPASPIAREALCARVIAEVGAAGALGRLAPGASMPGLPRALARTLGDLRLAGVRPEQAPPHLRAPFAAYEAALDDACLADPADLLRLAVEAVGLARTPPIGLPLIWADAPIRTSAEASLFRALAERASSVLATCPDGDPQTRHHLTTALHTPCEALPCPPTDALRRLQDHLFSAAAPPRGALDATVTLMAAPGESRECVEIARRIHREAARGVPLDEMAILLHPARAYRPHVVEALRRGAIPACFARGARAPDPSGRALLALLLCRAEGLSERRLTEYRSLDVAPRDAATSLDLRAVADLPVAAPWGAWLDALSALADRALADPEPVGALLDALRPMSAVGPVEAAEVAVVLAPHLTELHEPPPARRHGRVFVGSIDDARGLAFRVVFVPGLAERLFPAPITEDPLLGDAPSAALTDLPRRAEQVAAQRLALRLAVGAATERVALSWPRVDAEKGRPRVPSFYGLEILRAAEGVLPDFADLMRRAERPAAARLGWPAPADPMHAIDDAEHDLAVLHRALHAGGRPGAARYLLSANPHLARALRARQRRWRIARFTEADGLVAPRPEALTALRALAPAQPDPESLAHLADCPYRFLLHAVHRLPPREAPDLDPEAAPRTVEAARPYLHTLAARLAAGDFPAVPAAGACDRCGYRAVCGPREEERIAQKGAPVPADLLALRRKT